MMRIATLIFGILFITHTGWAQNPVSDLETQQQVVQKQQQARWTKRNAHWQLTSAAGSKFWIHSEGGQEVARYRVTQVAEADKKSAAETVEQEYPGANPIQHTVYQCVHTETGESSTIIVRETWGATGICLYLSDGKHYQFTSTNPEAEQLAMKASL